MQTHNSLAFVRNTIAEKKANGESCRCPACDGLIKVYSRKLSANQVRFLIALYRMTITFDTKQHDKDDVRAFAKFNQSKGMDYGQLKHWGLAKKVKNKDPKKKDSGKWSITSLGCEFVLGTKKMPDRVYTFNDTRIGDSGCMITIQTALSNSFDYQELMYGKS